VFGPRKSPFATRKIREYVICPAAPVIDHMRDWVFGTHEDEVVSMAVRSDGSYGIPQDLIYSFPVRCRDGSYSIVQGFTINDFSRSKMELTAAELNEERGLIS